ncbi:hypothetical protein [Amycolatopsis sp. Hca4]|uniref:hypothetical protein n=1 Tax=Amycolatopsis sp. Hca4 TaxID=2742131 RepID=UPI0015900123|nr:hypothetical protein [Amycolatopsis sp. Hca4]QKV73719.1 hypothetical protein HUT10_07990 [Amycolatopsis sp. Hca4]
MALDQVREVVRSKDTEKRVHAALHAMYLKNGASKPRYDDFGEEFRKDLEGRGLQGSDLDDLVGAVTKELEETGTDYEKEPEKFARSFIDAEGWAPQFTESGGFLKDGAGRVFLADRTTEVFLHTGYPGQGVYYDRENRLYQGGKPYTPQQTFTESGGFLKDSAGRVFLADKTTEVFLHTGYPGQGVYYDRQNQLYQGGKPYTPQQTFTESGGFLKDSAGRVFLADKTTEVFLHTGYPGQDIYYDRQNQLYQNGKPYVPGTPASDGEAVTDAEVETFLNDPSSFAELMQAVSDGDLQIDYSSDEEDIDSFDASHFVNVQ